MNYQEQRLVKDYKSHYIESQSRSERQPGDHRFNTYNMQAYDVSHVEQRIFDPSSRARRPTDHEC